MSSSGRNAGSYRRHARRRIHQSYTAAVYTKSNTCRAKHTGQRRERGTSKVRVDERSGVACEEWREMVGTGTGIDRMVSYRAAHAVRELEER